MGFFGVLWVEGVVGAGWAKRLAFTMAILSMVPMDLMDPIVPRWRWLCRGVLGDQAASLPRRAANTAR